MSSYKVSCENVSLVKKATFQRLRILNICQKLGHKSHVVYLVAEYLIMKVYQDFRYLSLTVCDRIVSRTSLRKRISSGSRIRRRQCPPSRKANLVCQSFPKSMKLKKIGLQGMGRDMQGSPLKSSTNYVLKHFCEIFNNIHHSISLYVIARRVVASFL